MITDAHGVDPAAAQPDLVIRGNPTDREVAAVVAALTALGGSPGDGPPATAANGWSAHWRRLGAAPRPGPDTWRMAARP